MSSMERAQQLRATQFVTVYGPGAILETLRGPRLICSLATSGLFHSDRPEQYQIVEPSLCQLLPGDLPAIFRLPNNAERGQDDSSYIYHTESFPRWSLCPRHGILFRQTYGKLKGCPECPAAKGKGEAWGRSREQAVSFVLVCSEGHLDDVPWVWLLHQGAKSECQPEHLKWRGAGGPLRSVSLECPACGIKKRFSDLYHREHTCTGQRWEAGKEREPCEVHARISQRAASDLFVPETISSLTVPLADTPLHRALRAREILPGLRLLFRSSPTPTQEDWEFFLQDTGGQVSVPILASDLERRNAFAQEVLEERGTATAGEARVLEFRSLRSAAVEGVPRSENFQLDARASRELKFGSVKLRVTPVSRLRVVIAQAGYRRLGGNLRSSGYVQAGTTWYPGVELFGEGLFLQLADSAQIPSGGERWRAWSKRYAETGEPAHQPGMVWWHTLSHRLIRALAIDSGYSAASVRERLYYDEKFGGGVLLYAVQPGGDGTLGGLIALVSRFEAVLRSALSQLDACSNDPLCGDQPVGAERVNGAACYACSLLSETACEVQNCGLDRRLLIETILE